ncbi:hypothetical protein SAMN05443575_3688 [Jatrophihabitans endophyticus]|uniref:Uncharacterized protein n=1 Tax=Jatrophihabitans endophyticus TaxID=1206085 RepID=A0A1M5RYL1_9ACTN|nr:hypothetical protein [Jatrophihabitans endophyticus]SHH31289.1 hypothetical protein SAMN05443575_3688 [Jatrophihabitans endophyticus]
MQSKNSWLDRAVTSAFSVLVIALVLFMAVQLLLSILTALIVIVAVAGVVGVAVAILRSRNRGW